MLLNNGIKLGSVLVRGGIKAVQLSAPVVTKGINGTVKFAKKESALAKAEVAVQSEKIKSDYAATKKVMSACSDDMAKVFAMDFTVKSEPNVVLS